VNAHVSPQPWASQAIILLSGIQAAGKSTAAQLLAERLPRSAQVRGDLFRRMVINGRADMVSRPHPSGYQGLFRSPHRHAVLCPAMS